MKMVAASQMTRGVNAALLVSATITMITINSAGITASSQRSRACTFCVISP
jgi:hypothetical protein